MKIREEKVADDRRITRKEWIGYVLSVIAIGIVIPLMFQEFRRNCSCNSGNDRKARILDLNINGSRVNQSGGGTDTSGSTDGNGDNSSTGDGSSAGNGIKTTDSSVEGSDGWPVTLAAGSAHVQCESNKLSSRPIVNPHQYGYLHGNAVPCSKKPLFLIVVHSAPENSALRNIIRTTWGSKETGEKTGSVLMFFMGQSASSAINQAVVTENTIHDDIVVQNFQDDARGQSYKAMSWLRFLSENCPQPEYVVKVNEEVFLNTYELSKLLKALSKYQEKGYGDRFVCQLWSGMPVQRDPNVQWYVSVAEYKPDKYPDYCSGLAYIIGRELLPYLYNASFYAPYFKLEDVFVTGMVKALLKVPTHNIWDRFVYDSSELGKVVSGKAIFGITSIDDQRRRSYWKELQKLQGSQTP